MAVDVRRKHPFLDFEIDFTGWSLTDRCIFESDFDECVKCSKGDAKLIKYLFDKSPKTNYCQVKFDRYESIKIMIWQNVIEKIECKKRANFKDNTFSGYYVTKGGYIFSTTSRRLTTYSLSRGKRYYYLPGKTKKVYDENKREWVL